MNQKKSVAVVPVLGPRSDLPFSLNTSVSTQHQHSIALSQHTFPRSALARAYLQQRRRHPDGPIQVCTVISSDGTFVDFGAPCDWNHGTAQRVANHEYKLDYFVVDHCDLDVAGAVDHDHVYHLHQQHQHQHQHQQHSPSASPQSPTSSDDSIPHSPFSLSSTEFDSDDTHHIHIHTHSTSHHDEYKEESHLVTTSTSSFSSSISDMNGCISTSTTSTSNVHLSPPTAAISAAHPSVSVADIRFMSNLTYGVRAAQGQRSSMEDEHTHIMRFEQLVATYVKTPDDYGQQAFFGVYDGHGGTRAVQYIREHLHINIARAMQPGKSLDQAIRHGTADTEQQLLQQQIQLKCTSGAVAAYLLFSGRQLFCANAGDSRVVLCRAGKAVDLTVDHRPGSVTETERILREGGAVEYGHLNGELAVSRAFGDVDPATGHKMRGLSSSPDLHQYFLTDDDDFLIVACDGLWDVLSSEGAISFARHSLAQHQDCQKTSDDLVAEALRRHSEDNVTVMVIGFGKTRDNGEQYIVDPPRIGPLASLTHTPHGIQRTRALSRVAATGLNQALSVHQLLAATSTTSTTTSNTIPTITQSPKPPQRRRIQLSSLSNLLAKMNDDDKEKEKNSSYTISSTSTITSTSTQRSIFIRPSDDSSSSSSSSSSQHRINHIPRSPQHISIHPSSSSMLYTSSLLMSLSQTSTPTESPSTTPPNAS